MSDALLLLHTFVDATALILALVLIVNTLHRTGRAWRTGWVNICLMGAMFSLALFFTMSDPISLGEAGIFDMRGLLIGTAAALLGPVVGLIALLTGMVIRLEIGNPGVVPGLIGMMCAFGGGLFWRATVRKWPLATLLKSVLLGVVITAQMLAIFAVPPALWNVLFTTLVPYTLATNIVGSILINQLISGEISFLSEAEKTRIEANTDHLTGLLNRRGLDLLLPDMNSSGRSSNGQKRGRAVLYFDIDHFKAINDTHGHGVGDDVLKRMVTRISNNLRLNDVFARLGGDEFAVILPDVDNAEAQRVADRCCSIVADEKFDLGDLVLPVTISLGAIWQQPAGAIDDMLNAADDALYKAKSKGRNAVVFVSGLALPVGSATGATAPNPA